MANTTELRHFGVKGMKWGVRKTPTQRAAKLNARATTYEKKSALLDRQAHNYRTSSLRPLAAALGTVGVLRAKGVGLDPKFSPQQALLNAGSHPEMAQIKREVKAENLRRKAVKLRDKAARISGKKMSDADPVKSKLTFKSAKDKAVAYVKNRHNQKQALVNADKTYRGVVLARRALKVLAVVAAIKLAYEASKRIPGQKALPSYLPKRGPMKTGKMYAVDVDGILRPYKMPKF